MEKYELFETTIWCWFQTDPRCAGYAAATIDKGHEDTVALLLANKADVNAKLNNGWTPLHTAVDKGHKGVVKLLLANKAKVNARTSDGRTPLHEVGDTEVATLLLANNADVNARNNEGRTPLHGVAILGHNNVVVLLLAHKAEVNAKNNEGFTPYRPAKLFPFAKLFAALLRVPRREWLDSNAESPHATVPTAPRRQTNPVPPSVRRAQGVGRGRWRSPIP